MTKFGIIPERRNESNESRARDEFENFGRSIVRVADVECVEYRSEIDKLFVVDSVKEIKGLPELKNTY